VLVLAFDTATAAVTVALHDGRTVRAEVSAEGAMRHGELLGPSIMTALDRAGASREEITEIAVGVGPGPFTGLRVGLVSARTLGLVLAVPVRGVCTLDVLAAEVAEPGPFLVATDARRREVYWASYGDSRTRVEGPHVSRSADVATSLPVAGTGAELYPAAFPNAVPPRHPSAAVLASHVVAGTVACVEPEPWYLRRPDVAAPHPPKPAL
jgi:tRNA threonylcarbamoyladenosine biosynthesis protein TsaB